jgi:hypothetical protein
VGPEASFENQNVVVVVAVVEVEEGVPVDHYYT